MPPESAAFQYVQLLALRALALLICDTAAGLAGRLAGSLAFATTAILSALTQIAGLNGLDVFHSSNLHKNFPIECYHIRRSKSTHGKIYSPSFGSIYMSPVSLPRTSRAGTEKH